jgi:hypothetical protein
LSSGGQAPLATVKPREGRLRTCHFQFLRTKQNLTQKIEISAPAHRPHAAAWIRCWCRTLGWDTVSMACNPPVALVAVWPNRRKGVLPFDSTSLVPLLVGKKCQKLKLAPAFRVCGSEQAGRRDVQKKLLGRRCCVAWLRQKTQKPKKSTLILTFQNGADGPPIDGPVWNEKISGKHSGAFCEEKTQKSFHPTARGVRT